MVGSPLLKLYRRSWQLFNQPRGRESRFLGLEPIPARQELISECRAQGHRRGRVRLAACGAIPPSNPAPAQKRRESRFRDSLLRKSQSITVAAAAAPRPATAAAAA